MAAAATVFAKRAGGFLKLTAKRDYYALRVFFGWIQSCEASFPLFRNKLRANYKAISVDEWELVLYTWRDEIVNGQHATSGNTRAQIIRAVNLFIDGCVFAKIMKPVSRLTSVKYTNREAKPKKCLAEVSDGSVASTNHESQNPRFTADDVAQNGRKDTAATLAKINKQRMGDLRRCAEEELKVWYEHFKEGERLLQLCDMPFSEIRKIIHSKPRTNQAKRWAIRKLFPIHSPDLALARYLTYVLNENGGLVPSAKSVLSFILGFVTVEG